MNDEDFFDWLKNNIQLKNLEKENVEDEFNIFTIISDKYKKEDLHSDILKEILTYNNNKFLNLFLTEIGFSNEDINESFENLNEVKIYREKGRIDISIYNDRNAIIVENKINNAVDQPNQLARYYEKIKNGKFDGKGKREVKKIVYLTLTLGKKPDFESYDTEYQEYTPKIEDLLVYMSAIGEETSLIDFIKKCKSQLNQNEIEFFVFLANYEKLLEIIGNQNMVKDEDKNAIKELMNNIDKKNYFKQLVSAWERRGDSIFELIKEGLLTDGLIDEAVKGYKTLIKKLDLQNKRGIYLLGNWDCLEIGYYSENNDFEDAEKDSLEKVIKELGIDQSTEKVMKRKNWVYFYFSCDDNTIEKIKELVKEIFDKLEKGYKELKQNGEQQK